MPMFYTKCFGLIIFPPVKAMSSHPPPPPGSRYNAQTEETALALPCCGGFLEVADFLIKVTITLTRASCLTPSYRPVQTRSSSTPLVETSHHWSGDGGDS